MRPKHAIAVRLISAATIVVFKWGADVFDGTRDAAYVRPAAMGEPRRTFEDRCGGGYALAATFWAPFP